MNKLKLTFLLFIYSLISSARDLPMHSSNLSGEVKNQIDGYIQQLTEGEKSTLLKKKDYYNVIYFITSYEISSIEFKNKKYLAKVIFHSSKRAYQNDNCPISVYEKALSEDLFEEIEFKKLQNKLQITKQLSYPYVLEGKGTKYILNSNELCKASN